MQDSILGPILFLDSADSDAVYLAALFIGPAKAELANIETEAGSVAVTPLCSYRTTTIYRARFALPQGRSVYRWAGQDYEVNTDLRGDARIAFVSCNGEEVGDLDREAAERNAMWSRLCAEHRQAPFALLLHGGDQVYADEVTKHHPLTEGWPKHFQDTNEGLDELRDYLREQFLARYTVLFKAPEVAWLSARVPSLTQWDDHDICDGWGSLPEKATHSHIGQTLFSCAREAYLVFQAATVDGDLPPRFADPSGGHFGWQVRFPKLRILAPDLRSERTRQQIMGPSGWAMMDKQEPLEPGEACLLMSSVPLLGPRLSIIEAMIKAVPKMRNYEDDLRDQWQSHAHRDEWRRMLKVMLDMSAQGQNITVLSGEIHLAARAEMPLSHGALLHQLVASGIAHRPPPKSWARFLGALSSWGDDPLPGHHISVRRIPGQASRYVAERNYLTLVRQGQNWQARWELEESGTTPPFNLGGSSSH